MIDWAEICYLINEHYIKNSKEGQFQQEIVAIFERLGWSRFRKEIEIEKSIPIGANGNLRPDILIRLQQKKLFVIELKRPTNGGNERTSDQLISYMLQEKMKFGLFIGASIQLFYDIRIDDDRRPVKLVEIEFSENNDDGRKLIEILKRDTFDEQKLVDYCQQKLLKIEETKTIQELIDFMCSSKGTEYVLQLISKDLGERYESKIVADIVSKISLRMQANGVTEHSISERDETIEKKLKEGVIINPSRIIKNNSPNDKRTMAGMKIGKFVQISFVKAFEQGLITESEIENLQSKDYSKSIFNANLEVLKDKKLRTTDKKGRDRYYKDVFCGNYRLSAQWNELHWDLFLSWLKKIGYDYKNTNS